MCLIHAHEFMIKFILSSYSVYKYYILDCANHKCLGRLLPESWLPVLRLLLHFFLRFSFALSFIELLTGSIFLYIFSFNFYCIFISLCFSSCFFLEQYDEYLKTSPELLQVGTPFS